jgi:hypothetical protein
MCESIRSNGTAGRANPSQTLPWHGVKPRWDCALPTVSVVPHGLLISRKRFTLSQYCDRSKSVSGDLPLVAEVESLARETVRGH